jgi:DNA-binding MarR family transcriptional regulator
MNDLPSLSRRRLRRPPLLAWLRVARVFQKIAGASARSFREYGLTVAQFDVLAHIGAAPGVTQQELAEALLVTKGNISQLLTRLEQAGMLERQQDGRTNCLALTAAGQQLIDQVVPVNEVLLEDLFAPLSAAEQRELVRLLRKLDQQIDA